MFSDSSTKNTVPFRSDAGSRVKSAAPPRAVPFAFPGSGRTVSTTMSAGDTSSKGGAGWVRYTHEASGPPAERGRSKDGFGFFGFDIDRPVLASERPVDEVDEGGVVVGRAAARRVLPDGLSLRRGISKIQALTDSRAEQRVA